MITDLNCLDPNLVEPGMIGKDYNEETGTVITIVQAQDWEEVKRYSGSGWLDKKSLGNQFEENDWLVAVKGKELGRFGGPGTEVYVYGYDGFHVAK